MLVVDASIAVKWVVQEADSAAALALLVHQLIAPDLLAAECSNILWKKYRSGGLTLEDALLAASSLAASQIELLPARPLLAAATRIACELDHPTYDCIYLALAIDASTVFVTADRRFLNLLARKMPALSRHVRPLHASSGLV